MINDAHEGRFQLIITKEVSRFSRNILDTISFTRELKALGIGILFLNDGIYTLDPDAELRLSIMGSIAQEESRKTSSRVKWGQTRQMERGVVFGRSLLGYDVKNGMLTVNPEGAKIVKLIFYKYGVEKKSTSVIAGELQEAGCLTSSGNVKWNRSHIIKILKNEKYVGDLVQKKTITPDYLTHEKKYNHGEEEMVILKNHHEGIISRDLWNLVQTEREKRNVHGKSGAGHSNRYALSGKIKCGGCGASFVSRKRYRKDGSFYRCWGCYTAGQEGRRHIDGQGREVGCDIGKQIREELAFDMVKMSLQSVQMDREWVINNVTILAAEAIGACENAGESGLEKLEKEISRITKKKENLLDAFFSGDITRKELGMMRERYDGQLKILAKQMEEEKTEDHKRRDRIQLRDNVKKQVGEIAEGKSTGEVLVRNLLEKMIIRGNCLAEVYLKGLPQKWVFTLKQTKEITF